MMDDHVIPDDEAPTEDELREIYAAQCRSLNLKPWEEPPCVLDPDVAVRGTDGEAKGMELLRRMRKAGVSRWHPDPLRALAEQATRSDRRKSEAT